MLDWAIAQDKYSVAIRALEGAVAHSNDAYDTDYSVLDKYKVTRKGEKVAVVAMGSFYGKGVDVCDELAKSGINATLINPRFVSGTDEQLLENLKADHQLVVTLEDGSIDGGFGERIARFYGTSDMKVLNCGVKKALYDRYDVNALLKDNRLTNEQIVEDILAIVK